DAWKNPPYYDPQYRYYNDLAVNAVFSIHMDEQGWLYFGTLDGTLHIMSQVDPESMRSTGSVVKPPYQSPIGPIIWAIATEEYTGNVWLGTQDGAMGFYRETEFGPPPSAPPSVTDFPVRAILKDADGHLWFGTDGAGISVYQGEAGWRDFRASDDGLADNHVRTLMQDKQGRIWAGTLNGVSVYENSRWQPFKMPSQLAGYPVMVIFEDTQGNYWFGTEGGGVGRYDGSRWLIFTSANGLVEDAVWSIAEDEKGYLWFGTASGGVSRYDNREREWTIFTQVTDYPLKMDLKIYNGVYSIFEDNQGSLWFTTRGGGVIRYDGKRWSTFTTSNGLGDDYVYDVFVDSRGTVWVKTRRGLYQSHEKGWAFFNVNDAWVNVVFEDSEGNLWFGTDRGAVKYDGETKTTVLEREKILSIFQDTKGNLWFRTGRGIIKYDGITFSPFPEIGNVRTIIEDDAGNIWVAREKTLGVDRYDGQQWVLFTYENTNGGLVDGNIIVIYPDKQGNVWFGTSDSISKFNGVNWQNYTVSHGLTFNKLHAILQDDRGIMWFGTDSGVIKFDGTVWITVATLDGLPDDKVYALWQDKRGDIWIGTGGGPVQQYLDRIPPKVQIVSGPKEGSVVTDSNVSFVFEGGDLVSPQKDLIFSVRLDSRHPLPSNLNPGNLEQWSKYSSETTATYTNLPDGGYVFRVVAKDKDLNSASISREFIIDTKQPEADIDEPEPGQMLRGFCNIKGTSTDKDFQKYSIEVKDNKDGAVVYSQTFSQKVEKGELVTWDTRNQPDGEYTITLHVTSLKGVETKRIFESADSVIVIVDNTPPKIQLIRPVMNEQVSGEIQILGTAYDENFKEYTVEYGKGTEPGDSDWKPISKQPIQTPVWENELLSWNTAGKEGEYSIRLRVLDQAGNEVEKKVAVVVQNPVVRSKGREIKANDQKARIYIPPNSLPESTSQLVITINKVPESQIQPSINKNIIPTGIAYDFEPRNVRLNKLKPASLTLPYEDALLTPTEINNLAVFVWNESKKDWSFVGGRIDKQSKTINTSVLNLGRYSIMKMDEKRSAPGKTIVYRLTCQPRVFSPNGGRFNTATAYISFHLNQDSKVTVKIYNLEGYLKKTLIEKEQLPKGNNRIDWNGRDSNNEVVPSGAYAIVVKAEGAEEVATKTVVVLNDR
ncbi:TPA: hypothetical protein EYP66_14660, partial [Candidatus Poribacteria bacterium]|nr:hypothetical protein [Candidatus Poribacteria bacterium]